MHALAAYKGQCSQQKVFFFESVHNFMIFHNSLLAGIIVVGRSGRYVFREYIFKADRPFAFAIVQNSPELGFNTVFSGRFLA